MSPIASNIATILALSSTALAFPKGHHHHQWGAWGSGYGPGNGTGTGRGFPHPTGRIPFPGHNHTEGNGAGSSAQATSLPVLTVTVLPVPASSASLSSNAVDNNVAAASTSLCISTSTSTTTTVQYVTVTASTGLVGSNFASLSVSGTASSGVAALSVSSTASGIAAPSVSSTTSSGVAALSVSSTASSDVAALSVSNTAFSAVPTSTDSVSAGEFFNQPSQSFSFGESSSPASWAAASTTVASETAGTSASSVASSAWASSTASSSSGASSGKVGLSYNTASLLSAFDGTSASWAYNWGASPDGTIPSDLEYVPMLWGLKSVSGWSEAAASAISSGSKHVLSFNEPDLSSQSNMDPATAAQNHIQYLNPLAGQVQIGSPAITNGAGTNPLMGIDWLNAFFKACGGQCQVDFVAFHWYDSASNIDGFKSHVQDVIDAASANGVSTVWLTEFGTTSGSDSDIATFITEATSFLDSTSAVERYAYFMVGEGSGQLLSSDGALNTLGEAYVG